ncbi:Peptidase S8 propeptide/proteinase inhibitor I9 [Dillenia turbinata]|uniref:Peptidase S8 propeptide/proteinase inhibitor I9 n=1 Tax=Dillenia turbinata TaxID=194707 RepID=A0AAN8ZIM2_9MAGN
MEIFLIFLMFLSCFSLSCFGESKVDPRNDNGIYIVYMGAANSDNHAHLLSSVLRRKENAIVHNYRKGFSGFAAHLTEEEAHTIARKPGVVSVFPDPILQLHTTRSWDFLKYQAELETDCNLCSNSDSQSHGYDTIIGILDTGIWPESDSFSDKDLGPLPSRWKGICMEGQNFSTSNCNRIFESDIVLGGEKVIEGTAINFANIQKSPIYPLIYASTAKSNSSEEKEARNCNEGTLDKALIKGKIVLCDNDDASYSPKEKLEEVKENGGIGVILVDSMIKLVASNFGDFPMTVISSEDAMAIHSYINSTRYKSHRHRNPVATILPTQTVTEYKPAPMVAYFSARGPFYGSKNLLKANLLPLFNVLSIQLNNLRAPITTDSGSVATPYDYGAGEISPSGPLQPGLVYATEIVDYLEFLCNYGYNITTIKLISSSVPSGFSCPKNSKPDLISNLNYPSIAVSGFDGKESKKVNRTVTNVGDDDEATYTASIKAPDGLTVKVIPEELQFTKNNKKLSFQVEFLFTGSSAPKGDLFGSITWTNGKYKVQSPFVVSTSTD